ncbi:MAG: ATP-binding protein [Thermoplasmatota archaeon]
MLRVEDLSNNLLNNAVKYSPEGGTVQIRAQQLGEWVQVSIKNEGPEMTNDQLHLVFDKNYKADESRHNSERNGLGMSICKRIIEKHDGKIWAESKGLGTGTMFYFTLPASKNRAEKTIALFL